MKYCVPNIGPMQQRRRLLLGLIMIALSVAVGLWLVGAGAARASRLLLFLPLLFGFLGLLQVREKTCVALAARGLRNMDQGSEPITDPAALAQVKAQARRVQVRALAAAAAITAVFVALP
jgi:hypothetical protein